MAYGKPIIHIDGGANDIAKAYLEKYPFALIIHPADDFQKNVEQLLSFLKQTLGKRVEFQTLRRQFEMNTPEYTAERIVKTLG